jgi:hypothetical protein
MVKRLSILNELLINRYDLLEKGDIEKTPEFQTKMALDFITRSDAKNYMIFGDPGAHLRI